MTMTMLSIRIHLNDNALNKESSNDNALNKDSPQWQWRCSQ